MVTVRVRDRGRDIAVHRIDTRDEAREIARVYALLGYPQERILVEDTPERTEEIAA